MMGGLDVELAVRIYDAVDLAILEGIRAAGALYEGKQRVGDDQPAGGPVPALDRPLGDNGDLGRVFRVVAAFQVAQHAIETGDLVEEVVVDGVIDLFPNLIHKEIEGGHHIDIDTVSVRYIFVIIIHRLIGEVIGTVVEDAFRGHEEIHGEVLSAANGGGGTDPVTVIDR